jgi:hypothetical protein
MDERRLEGFARDLRDLRRRVGSPSYQVMARETGYSAADLAAAAAGKALPPLTVTLAYVSACGGDAGAWADRWRDLAGARPEPPLPEEPDDPVPFPEPARLRQRRRVRVAFVLAGLVVAPLVWTVVVANTPQAPRETSTPWVPAAMPSTSLTELAPAAPVTTPSSAPTTSTTARASTRPAPPLTPSTPPTEFKAVAGPACPMDFTKQVHISSAPGDDGWQEVRGGSYTGDDCDNRYVYSALIYDPWADSHPENYFQWRFSLNGPAPRRCLVEVYIPDSANASAPVWYDVADRFENIEVNIAQFMIDQAASRGKWVIGASITVNTAQVLIQIGGDGEGLPPGRNSIAAAPLRLTCSRR